MSQRVRIADGFKTQSAEQLVTTAGAVITGLTNNPAFPAPTVDLKAVQAAADALNAALAAQAHGGTAATADKNNKQEALIIALRKLKHYVEDNCGNDLAVLLSSGFQAAATTRNRTPLANPSIFSVDLGHSTELVLKVTPIPRAKNNRGRCPVLITSLVSENSVQRKTSQRLDRPICAHFSFSSNLLSSAEIFDKRLLRRANLRFAFSSVMRRRHISMP